MVLVEVAVNKHVLASMSINPNGIINALVIYVLIALMFAQNVTKWKYTVWTLIWTTSAAFFPTKFYFYDWCFTCSAKKRFWL